MAVEQNQENGVECVLDRIRPASAYFARAEIAGGEPIAVLIMMEPRGEGASVFGLNTELDSFIELPDDDQCIAVIREFNKHQQDQLKREFQ